MKPLPKAKCRNPGCKRSVELGVTQLCDSTHFGVGSSCVPMAAWNDPDVPFRHHTHEFEVRADRLLTDLSSLPDPGIIATPSFAAKVVSGIRSARHDMLAEYAEEAVAALKQELEDTRAALEATEGRLSDLQELRDDDKS